MKLYYENQYIKDFRAVVLDVKKIDEKFHIVLDNTAFFPGGGGQFCDLGFIENKKVIDVYEEHGTIYHVLDCSLNKGQEVSCLIDWDRRLEGMQQHLGQHVLSGCFFKLFNANTVGFHMGSDISTVDINGHLEEGQIREAEKKANEIIKNNIPVEFLLPTKEELKKLKLRRALPKTNEAIRVVKIGDLDINACCGVHPQCTLELRAIKIRRWEKHKGATRIEYIAGTRAIEDYMIKDNILTEICRYLNCGEDSAVNAIKNLSSKVGELMEENKKIRGALSQYEIKALLDQGEKIKDLTIIKTIYENGDPKHISKLATRLAEEEKAIVLFATKDAKKANLIFTCSKGLKNVNMNDILKDSITLIDGRGGGSPLLAQGAGKNIGNLEATMDYALRKIKEKI